MAGANARSWMKAGALSLSTTDLLPTKAVKKQKEKRSRKIKRKGKRKKGEGEPLRPPLVLRPPLDFRGRGVYRKGRP